MNKSSSPGRIFSVFVFFLFAYLSKYKRRFQGCVVANANAGLQRNCKKNLQTSEMNCESERSWKPSHILPAQVPASPSHRRLVLRSFFFFPQSFQAVEARIDKYVRRVGDVWLRCAIITMATCHLLTPGTD